jgi:hypothetical protein
LNQERLRSITDRLSKFAGVKVDIYGIGIGNPWNKSESEESIRVAGQLVGALTDAHMDAAGWVVNACSGLGALAPLADTNS